MDSWLAVAWEESRLAWSCEKRDQCFGALVVSHVESLSAGFATLTVADISEETAMSCCLVVDRAEVLGLKGGLIAVSCFCRKS